MWGILFWTKDGSHFGNFNMARYCTWKIENNLDCLNWPSQSPDINIIDNVWRILKIRLKRSLETIRNRNDLVREVLRIWESLTVPYVRDLYHTIP